jgi:hypothetical protein
MYLSDTLGRFQYTCKPLAGGPENVCRWNRRRLVLSRARQEAVLRLPKKFSPSRYSWFSYCSKTTRTSCPRVRTPVF